MEKVGLLVLTLHLRIAKKLTMICLPFVKILNILLLMFWEQFVYDKVGLQRYTDTWVNHNIFSNDTNIHI